VEIVSHVRRCDDWAVNMIEHTENVTQRHCLDELAMFASFTGHDILYPL
jgi:hypothetical protein